MLALAFEHLEPSASLLVGKFVGTVVRVVEHVRDDSIARIANHEDHTIETLEQLDIARFPGMQQLLHDQIVGS